jgi:hypothetical protein
MELGFAGARSNLKDRKTNKYCKYLFTQFLNDKFCCLIYMQQCVAILGTK